MAKVRSNAVNPLILGTRDRPEFNLKIRSVFSMVPLRSWLAVTLCDS